MEGGAFAEWDFIRGLREGWIPPIPPPTKASVDLYGTCEDILLKTKDDMSILTVIPDPSTLPKNLKNWQGFSIDDDLVVSHGESLQTQFSSQSKGEQGNHSTLETDMTSSGSSTTNAQTTITTIGNIDTPSPASIVVSKPDLNTKQSFHLPPWFPVLAIIFFATAIKMVFFRRTRYPWDNHKPHRSEYEPVGSPLRTSIHMTV